MGSVGSAVLNMFMDASGLGDMLGGLLTIIILPIVIWNTLVCLFGYKLFKIQLAIIGFLFGAVFGAVLGAIGGQAIFAVLLGLVLGALGAWLSLKLYKLGVFIMVSSSASFILTVLLVLLTQSFNPGAVVLAAVLGIGLGILAVFLDKYIIIFYTGISGGLLAGIALGLSMGNVVLGVLLGIVLAVVGVWLQFRMERKDGGQSAGSVPTSPPTTVPKAAPALALGDMAKSLTASAKGATDSLMFKVGKHENLNPNQTVLVSNKGNYWCKDMPLVVTEVQVASQAGDEEHVYLNLALQNLSDQPIVGIYFDVTCHNLLKQELEGLTNLSVLDLNIAEGQHWFTTTSIRLPDKTTRKCLLTVKNVVLKNEKIWSNEQGLSLADIPAAAALALSSELAAEYHLQLAELQKMRNTAAVYTYTPSFAAEHWFCSCGQLNTGTDRCVCCAMDKAALADLFDESKLQADREHRIAEKLRIEGERRQKIADQTEAVKQKSLELAGQAKVVGGQAVEQAKQGYAAAATKTAELYGVAAAKAKEWCAAAKVFVIGHKKQVLAGVGAVAVVVVGGVAIKAMLDAPPKPAPASSSGSSAIPAAGSAVSQSGSSDQAALLEQQKQEEKRQYELAEAKAYLELMNGLLKTHQYDFGEGSLRVEGYSYMYDPDGNVYGQSMDSEGVIIDQDTPAIFFAQQFDMDNNGSRELILVLGDQFSTNMQIWGFDGTSSYLITEQSLGETVAFGQSSSKGARISVHSGEALGGVRWEERTFFWLEDGQLCTRSTSYTDNTLSAGTDQATINYFVDGKSVPKSEYQSTLLAMDEDYSWTHIFTSSTKMATFDLLIDSGRLTRGLMASLYRTVLTDLALQEGNTPTEDVDLSGVWLSQPLSEAESLSSIFELALFENQTCTSIGYTHNGGGVGGISPIRYYLLAGNTLYLSSDTSDTASVQRLTYIPGEETLILPADFFDVQSNDEPIRELQKASPEDQTILNSAFYYRSDPLPRKESDSSSDRNSLDTPTSTVSHNYNSNGYCSHCDKHFNSIVYVEVIDDSMAMHMSSYDVEFEDGKAHVKLPWRKVALPLLSPTATYTLYDEKDNVQDTFTENFSGLEMDQNINGREVSGIRGTILVLRDNTTQVVVHVTD